MLILGKRFSFIKSFIKRPSYWFMNFTVGTKMVIVYLVVILIPTVIYSVYFYLQISNNIISMYETGNQQLMEQAYTNFKGEISQIESTSQIFQYNKSVTQFLNGYYTTEADEIYVYLKDIQPLFAYGHASNKNIEDITIYKYRPSTIELKRYILGLDRFTGSTAVIKSIPPEKGLWVLDDEDGGNLLKYYKKCYSTNFYRELGFIQITVKSGNLLNRFNVTGNDQVLLFQHDNQWFIIRDGLLKKIDVNNEADPTIRHFFESGLSEMKDGYRSNARLLVNSLQIKELDVRAVLLTPSASVMGDSREYTPLVYLAVLLVFLSLIYYVIISSVTRRMVGLARHIRKTDHDNLTGYRDLGYKDEIGALIKSYNEMIDRIGSLVNSLNIAELKKREADFYALQAQIKPHFIYNSLETIRMMAETNDDPSVADITYNLGRFMRYNLSRRRDETLLKDEVENVNNYLQIYRVSMGERLVFSINVNCGIGLVKCPGFILQPLVENSLHHGLSSHRGRCIIEININEDGDFMEVVIGDNGVGIPEEKLKTIQGVLEGTVASSELKPKGNGIGIVNVNERIKSYFGNRSGLSIESGSDSGTTCRIRFEKVWEGPGECG